MSFIGIVLAVIALVIVLKVGRKLGKLLLPILGLAGLIWFFKPAVENDKDFQKFKTDMKESDWVKVGTEVSNLVNYIRDEAAENPEKMIPFASEGYEKQFKNMKARAYLSAPKNWEKPIYSAYVSYLPMEYFHGDDYEYNYDKKAFAEYSEKWSNLSSEDRKELKRLGVKSPRELGVIFGIGAEGIEKLPTINPYDKEVGIVK